ncbi:MAG: chemotaxis protein CheW [Myxococcota bacterium]
MDLRDDRRTFLTLRLNDARYGIAVTKVQEIRPYETSGTRVPHAASHLRGVFNVRGHVVPLVDLNRCLGLPPQPTTDDTRVIIVEVDWSGETVLLGAIADAVFTFLALDDESLVEPPPRGTGIPREYLLGLGPSEAGFVRLLDIDRVLTQPPATTRGEAPDFPRRPGTDLNH